MGNHHATSTSSSSVGNAKPPKLKKKLDLKSLEKSLLQVDTLIEMSREAVQNAHDRLCERIHASFSDTRENEAKIYAKKSELLQALELNKLHKRTVKFVETMKSLHEILLDSFFHVNKYDSMQQKIKYLKFYNQFEVVETNALAENCYNYIILPVSRNKIFYCMGLFNKKSFMKITDRHGRELHRRAISSANYYKQFFVYGNHIAGLYEQAGSAGTTLIEIYTDELSLVASSVFNAKFDQLLYMNSHEVVCKSELNYYQYIFFNLSLEPTFSFRVLNRNAMSDEASSAQSPAHVTNGESDVVLLGSNLTELFLYHTKKKFLKVLSRQTGRAVYSIEFDKIVQLDNLSNISLLADSSIIFKCNSTRRINCFDYASSELTESTTISNLNVNFKCFNVNCFNDVYSCDHLNKKIYFLWNLKCIMFIF